MNWSQQDIDYMRVALAEAEAAAGKGEIPVGAVLVENGAILSRAHNCSITDNDPSGHAEVAALRAAGRLRENYRLAGTTLLRHPGALRPCARARWCQARVKRVVFGAYDKKAGALGSVEDLSDSKALNHRFEVNGGVLADEASALLQAFFRSRR